MAKERVKLWCYSFWDKQILYLDFDVLPKSYKFVLRPNGYNNIVLKENLNKVDGEYAFAETKEALINVIKEYLDTEIERFMAKIKTLESQKRELDNR